jgi:RimJ/RimL family protein N-acetyltransferase
MQLNGPRVYLRPLGRDDTELILRWRRDPTIANQLFSDHSPTRSEHEAWFTQLQQRDDRIEFVIVVHEGERPVGTIGLNQINRARGEAEYGIMIGEKEWRGKGIAREASELILHYAFEKLNLQAITLNLFADNAPARLLYQRLGFVENPALAGEREKNGLGRRTMTMQLSRTTWQRQRV